VKSRHGECRTLALQFDRKRQSFTPAGSEPTAEADRGKLRSALAALWARTPAAADNEGSDV